MTDSTDQDYINGLNRKNFIGIGALQGVSPYAPQITQYTNRYFDEMGTIITGKTSGVFKWPVLGNR